MGRNAANGVSNESIVAGTVKAGLLWGAGSATGDMWAGGFQQANPLRKRNPVTAKDWTQTIWLNGHLDSSLIWQGTKGMYVDTMRPTGRNFSILLAWAAMDKEIQK